MNQGITAIAASFDTIKSLEAVAGVTGMKPLYGYCNSRERNGVIGECFGVGRHQVNIETVFGMLRADTVKEVGYSAITVQFLDQTNLILAKISFRFLVGENAGGLVAEALARYKVSVHPYDCQALRDAAYIANEVGLAHGMEFKKYGDREFTMRAVEAVGRNLIAFAKRDAADLIAAHAQR